MKDDVQNNNPNEIFDGPVKLFICLRDDSALLSYQH